ncbi:MAG: CoA transferase [Gammaproteobacteria bacterium]|jgi:alpha-methylacyl-CoA racemase|nr:CoA transferase [Gammaproteobacteria bacterium]
MAERAMAGPLAGTRVLEFAAIGPAPFCGMLLSDFGAEVLRIDRPGQVYSLAEVPARGRSSLVLDLKDPSSVAICLDLADRADVLIEGFRPGVMERLGLGPEHVTARNPRLVYGRMTGWGQSGPLAQSAGHDINFIALAGALGAMGPSDRPPPPPLNLVGDYGGGALYLAFGLVAALLERERSGRGQVVDAAIVDGTASIMSLFHWLRAQNIIGPERGSNGLDGAAHYYRCYECADGKHIAIGAIEPHFFAILAAKVGFDLSVSPAQYDQAGWASSSAELARIFRSRSRAEWCELLEGTDSCFAPVLSIDEAPDHPHMRARATFERHFGVVQSAVAPRLSRTPGSIQGQPPQAGEGGWELASRWGVFDRRP